MKYLILALGVVLLNGCKDYSTRDKYRPMWDKYLDSCAYYSDKFRCCISKNNSPAADIYLAAEGRCSDSADKYYALMYPHGNPASEPEHVPPPCDCK